MPLRLFSITVKGQEIPTKVSNVTIEIRIR